MLDKTDLDAHTSSVQWVQEGGNHLAIGTCNSTTKLQDMAAEKHLRLMDGHMECVSSLSWNNYILSTCRQDFIVINHVISVAHLNMGHKLTKHQATIKVLTWSPNKRNLLGTGGGTVDHCIKFWDSQTRDHLNSINMGNQVYNLLWNPHDYDILFSHS